MNESEPTPPVGPEELRQLRREAGLTQLELAGKAGCSPSWVVQAENGYVPRYGQTLDRVLNVLRQEQV